MQTGYNFMKGRYQLPDSGRFNRPDPARDWDWENPRSINLYQYVRNNPINSWDPFGLRPLTKGEIRLAKAIFGNTIDYSKVEIRRKRFAGLIKVPKMRAMAPKGKFIFTRKTQNTEKIFQKRVRNCDRCFCMR